MCKRALNDVKMVLYSEQFGLEATSSHFCAVYNLGLKLLQVDSCIKSFLRSDIGVQQKMNERKCYMQIHHIQLKYPLR